MKDLYHLVNLDNVSGSSHIMVDIFMDNVRKIKFFDNLENFKNFRKMQSIVDKCVFRYNRRYTYQFYPNRIFYLAIPDIFLQLCIKGCYTDVKTILLTYEIDHYIDHYFQEVCVYNQYKIVKLLLSLGCSTKSKMAHHTKVDIYSDDNHAFRYACYYKNYKIVKLLLSIGRNTKISKKYERHIPININIDTSFPMHWELHCHEMIQRYLREGNLL